MKNPKHADDQVRMSLRIPSKIHTELVKAAEYNGRFLNDEVLERIKATPAIDLLTTLLRENAELKAMIKEMHDLATNK